MDAKKHSLGCSSQEMRSPCGDSGGDVHQEHVAHATVFSSTLVSLACEFSAGMVPAATAADTGPLTADMHCGCSMGHAPLAVAKYISHQPQEWGFVSLQGQFILETLLHPKGSPCQEAFWHPKRAKGSPTS